MASNKEWESESVACAPKLEEGSGLFPHESGADFPEVTAGKRCTLLLKGLDCAKCAAGMEKAVREIDGIIGADVNFASGLLTIEVDQSSKLPHSVRQAAQAIHRVDPDIVISVNGQERDDEEENTTNTARKIAFGFSVLFFLVGLLAPLPYAAKLAVFLVSYGLVGAKVVRQAVKNISQGRVFDEYFLMSVATIGAFCIGEFAEGAAVMLFYEVGEYFQDKAVDRSRKSIASLMDIHPDYANLKSGGATRRVSPEEVAVGDLILIRPGEKIPLDGTVEEGFSSLDMSALTGESLPRSVKAGDNVLSGCVNQSGVLTVRVAKVFGESTASKILDLVQSASSHKAKTENFISKFAGIYTPAVVFSALALAVLPPLFLPGAVWSDWIGRALTFLVVSCPCALVISIPLSFFAGIGGASKNGILVKGSNYLEALNSVDTVVFDKTGTLTNGNFQVSKIAAAKGIAECDVVKYAAFAEHYSSHPIAASIRSAYGTEIDESRISGYEEIPGRGIRATVDGKIVLVGNAELLNDANLSCNDLPEGGTTVFLAVDGRFAGSLTISDEVKADSKKTIGTLKSLGIHTAMLTGDSQQAGLAVADRLGVERVFANLLPQHKVEQMEQMRKQIRPGGKLVFVGDGLNDAPVLAQADVGVAMGGAGSDAAIEAADVVLMTDEPSKLISAIQISRNTHKIVWQNIVFALAVKLLILVLAVFGMATMWAAVFADVGVTILAVFNSMRASHFKQAA